jgi:hypothetical protein
MTSEITAWADFSPDRKFRWVLGRQWGGGLLARFVCFVMLNPSKADALIDDPTVKRCIGYGMDWGFDGLLVANMYAYVATDPDDLLLLGYSAIGEENDTRLRDAITSSQLTVVAWGNHKAAKGRRSEQVIDLIESWAGWGHYLKLNKDGSPSHPLYLKKDLKPKRWRP